MMLVSPTYPATYRTIQLQDYQSLPQAILQDRLHVSESTFAATGRVSLERAEEKEAPDDLGENIGNVIM